MPGGVPKRYTTNTGCVTISANMSAKDTIHNAVKNALIKDGWKITHDPFTLGYKDATVFVDLGAERLIAAERGGEKIAVEIKSFIKQSAIHDMEIALGQYLVYLSFLEVVEPNRRLYVALEDVVYNTVFQRESFQWLVKRNQVPLIIVDIKQETIREWIS